MSKNLVIVESPAKAKTIKKYLGKNYLVSASMGHVRDLPKSRLGIDINRDFEPQYITIRGKGELLSKLKKEAANSDKIFLATDPDREGEAISWHLREYLDREKVKSQRIKFNEITKEAVKQAVAHPQDIDINLVDSQQARRILDRLVGYQISPLLWRKIKKGLSAGRVQSSVMKLVCDRELEIENFEASEYWSIDVVLTKDDVKDQKIFIFTENDRVSKDQKNVKTTKLLKNDFVAEFYGTKSEKIVLKSQKDAEKILNKIKGHDFVVIEKKEGTRKKGPNPPFTTSTLQQTASKVLGYTSKRTMSIAQKLYEGFEVDNFGVQGLITYMRTDSQRISDQAKSEVRDFIKNVYGSDFLPSKPRDYKSPKSAQDAHEAIRPTNVNITPEIIKNSSDKELYKLYKLIWERFLASQMTDAIYNTLAYTFQVQDFVFKNSCQSLKFKGFSLVYSNSDDKSINILPDLTVEDRLNAKVINSVQHFTQPPARFNEASLIKIMEELGIGRPSTYSPTISTILSRGYVIKDNKNICPTELGKIVTNLMIEHFQDVIDADFTAKLETQLDQIASGSMTKTDMLNEFYPDFNTALHKAEQLIGNIEIQPEEADEICEKCGRNLIYKLGKYGKFLACPGFPECRNIKPIVKLAEGRCPICQDKVIERKSKTGRIFYSCIKNKNCKFITWDQPQNQECPKCHSLLLKKNKKTSVIYCYNEKCDFQTN